MRTHEERTADIAVMKSLLAHFGGESFGSPGALEAALSKLDAE